tara:strand:+ start:2598 stop:3881 length:1284 start_codon:yes stop_codon:yes gene_type:complete
MLVFYRVLTSLLYPVLCILIYLRKILKKEDPKRYKEKIFSSSFKFSKDKNKKLFWLHAASIGEFKSILPIIDELNNKNKKLEFLITTTTLSSSHVAKEELKKYNNVHHRFFPLDVGFLISKFLDIHKPNALFLVDSEIWPNLITFTYKRKIPIALINARITSKSYSRWMMFPKSAKKIFSKINICLSSNSETQNYLDRLGASNVFFYGNIKLIKRTNVRKIINKNKKILLENKFWLAASTHVGEDNFCIQTHKELKKEFENIKTIIAPRHIDRAKKIKYLCEKNGIRSQILNDNEIISLDSEILILNSFGILQNYYKYIKSVFIGKSLVKELRLQGGQNPLDAANLGCKIYHGPYVQNFKEIYNILSKHNISKQINDYLNLSNYIKNDLLSPKKDEDKFSKIIENYSQETLTKTINIIEKYLMNENI